jgi:hypothetical protein
MVTTVAMVEDPEEMEMEGPTDPTVMYRADRQKSGTHKEKCVTQEQEEEETPQILLIIEMTMKNQTISTGTEVTVDSRTEMQETVGAMTLGEMMRQE